ncbi:MAG: hypothetical protein K0Q84_2690 [Arthrobacter sp.]|nr:hypothetical protein [Arthrobacter sp.]
MNKLKKLGTMGTVGVLVTGGLFLGTSPAANAATCRAGTATPTNSLSGSVLTSTSFENNSLSPFVPTTAGTGTATVSNSRVHSGLCSIKLHVTSDAGSMANMALNLSPGTKRVNADAWVNITTAGLAGNNVPYVRFLSGSTRLADVYRYNDNGQLWLRVTKPNGTFTYTKLRSSSIPLGTWHRIQMEVTANGSSSAVRVWFDGILEYSSTVTLGATSLSKVQFGAEHVRQKGDQYIDDVVIKKVS